MQIYEYPGEKRIDRSCVLALGFFDGVHVAHRDLILSAREEARRLGLPLGIFSFRGAIKSAVGRIYTDDEKCEIFESLGADFVIFADFAAIKDCEAEDFVRLVLVGELKCSLAVCGFNFRFGRGASGDAGLLREIMESLGGGALVKQEITLGGETVSATRIRELIARGEMQKATELLGAPYYIKGRIERGNSIGRTLGFPTVNLQIGEKVVPRRGVYRTAIPIGERIYTAVTNVGVCPTFEARDVHLEGYILDFEGDIYGEEIRVFLLEFMREEIAFSSPNELKMQINVDKNRAIKENGDITWQELGLK